MTKKILFIGIVVVAFILRFYRLGEVPVSIDWDEAAIGYNAYSILTTGKDEYGTRFPLVFRSFDDYKPPLYFYLTVPSVALFGLNEFAVRFPSALFGTLTVIVVYFMVGELVRRQKDKLFHLLPFVTAFLLAISPWHVHFSRVAFEATTGVFFNVLGVYLFLRGLRNGWFLALSAICFSLALYEYHSERVFVPLLVITLAVLYWRELLSQKVAVICSVVVGIAMVTPLILLLFNPANLTRLAGTSSLADQTGLLERNIVKLTTAQKNSDLLGTIFANRRITYAQVLVNGYLSHFNFNWLFINGDQERHKAPGMGLMYWWELPFLLAGLYQLKSTTAVKRRVKLLVFIWFLISPVAASVTTEVPHAIRTIVFLPTFQIFTGLGLLSFWDYILHYKKNLQIGIICSFAVVFLFNFAYFTNLYFVHLNKEYSKYWQYGYKQTVEYVVKNYGKYDHIIVSTKLEQPHIFFLFFLKYSPEIYLQNGGTYSGGFAENRNAFDKYEFHPFSIGQDSLRPKTLYIGTPGEIPGEGIYHIDYLDGTRAIEFYET